jgi:hypothetical protein
MLCKCEGLVHPKLRHLAQPIPALDVHREWGYVSSLYLSYLALYRNGKETELARTLRAASTTTTCFRFSDFRLTLPHNSLVLTPVIHYGDRRKG